MAFNYGALDKLIEFDEEEMAVEGNSIKYFYGTVTPPDDDTRSEGRLKPIEFGQYTQSFCVQCRKGAAAAGAAIQIITCSLPINVNVVEGRTKENMYITPKPIKIIHILIAVIIIILILIILVYLLHFLKKKRFEEKPQTKTKKNIYQIPKPTSPKKGICIAFLSNLAQNHHAPINAINV